MKTPNIGDELQFKRPTCQKSPHLIQKMKKQSPLLHAPPKKQSPLVHAPEFSPSAFIGEVK